MVTIGGDAVQRFVVHDLPQQVDIRVVVGDAELLVDAEVPATHPLDLPVELGIEGLLVPAPVR